MAQYSRNAIYSRLYTAINAAYTNAYITSSYEISPPQFPAVFIREIGSVQNTNAVTFSVDDDQYQSTYEVQIFCDKQMTAYQIMSIVQAEMRAMFYIEDMIQPVENLDKTIYRLVARFHRTIGGGEEMPT